MTIEEKARAYDEALKKIQPLYEQAKKDDNPIWSAYEYLVPELSESEDEKTRKRLIEFISDIKRISESGRRSWAVRKDDVEMCDAFLSYLEKQKELPFVKDVMLGYPGLYFYDGERMHFRGPAMEEKQKEQKPTEDKYQQELEATDRWQEGYEAGYNAASKPVEWSEDDEKMLTNIIERGSVQVPPYTTALREEQIEWLTNRLKSLRPQPKQEWSEEDEKLLDIWLDVIDRNDWRMDEGFCKASREFINKLKSLRPQPLWKPSEEQEEPEYYQHFDPDC